MGNMGSAHPLVEVNVSFKESLLIVKELSSGHELEMDGRTDGRTDRPTDATKGIQYSPPPTFCGGGIII